MDAPRWMDAGERMAHVPWVRPDDVMMPSAYAAGARHAYQITRPLKMKLTPMRKLS